MVISLNPVRSPASALTRPDRFASFDALLERMGYAVPIVSLSELMRRVRERETRDVAERLRTLCGRVP